MDCPSLEIYEMKCTTNLNNFTVFFYHDNIGKKTQRRQVTHLCPFKSPELYTPMCTVLSTAFSHYCRIDPLKKVLIKKSFFYSKTVQGHGYCNIFNRISLFRSSFYEYKELHKNNNDLNKKMAIDLN